jgi:hypothetical protein
MVRGMSSKMSWKEGLKNDPHKKREVYKDKLRDEGAAEFERQMMDFCVKHMILPRPETKEPEPDYPFDDLKENTPCRLHVPIGRSGKTLEAATAIAIPGRTYNEEFIPDAMPRCSRKWFTKGLSPATLTSRLHMVYPYLGMRSIL